MTLEKQHTTAQNHGNELIHKTHATKQHINYCIHNFANVNCKQEHQPNGMDMEIWFVLTAQIRQQQQQNMEYQKEPSTPKQHKHKTNMKTTNTH